MQWIRREKPTGGQIIFDGEDITKLEGAKLQPYHKRMQIIFQDPYSALDPHHNVEEIIREPMSLYTNVSKSDIDEQIVELLKKVGMKADDIVSIQDVRTPNRSAVRWNRRWSSGRRGILWPAISGSAAANLTCI